MQYLYDVAMAILAVIFTNDHFRAAEKVMDRGTSVWCKQGRLKTSSGQRQDMEAASSQTIQMIQIAKQQFNSYYIWAKNEHNAHLAAELVKV